MQTAKSIADIKRLYVETKLTLRQIAEKSGISYRKIRHLVEDEDWPRRSGVHRSASLRLAWERRKAGERPCSYHRIMSITDKKIAALDMRERDQTLAGSADHLALIVRTGHRFDREACHG